MYPLAKIMKHKELKEKFINKRFKIQFFRSWELWKLDDEYYDEFIEIIIRETRKQTKR